MDKILNLMRIENMLDFCFLYDLLYDKIENKLDFSFLYQFSKQLEAAVTRQV